MRMFSWDVVKDWSKRIYAFTTQNEMKVMDNGGKARARPSVRQGTFWRAPSACKAWPLGETVLQLLTLFVHEGCCDRQPSDHPTEYKPAGIHNIPLLLFLPGTEQSISE